MTEAVGPGPGAASSGPRRHPAVRARVVAGGVSVGAGLALMAVMAAGRPIETDAESPVPLVVAPPSSTTIAPSPEPETVVVVRRHPVLETADAGSVQVGAPPSSASPPASGPSASGSPSAPPAAPRVAPATPAPAPAPAPAPTPAPTTRTRAS
jgi:hypothetical protein